MSHISNSAERSFRIPVTWEMCGWVNVMAASLEDALADFDPNEHKLPKDASYVDGSFRLTSDDPDTVKDMSETT